MVTEITSSTYENGKRIEIQRVTYDKSDDLYNLANTQRRYESLCAQLETAEGDYRERLQGEKEKLEAELAEKERIVAGYDDGEAEN